MFFDGFTPLPGAYMASDYSTAAVLASVAIAILASFVTLGLARRVRLANARMARVWWIAGALVMGTGIWSTHFVGMQAFHLPIALGYDGARTLASWIAAVVASGIALWLAGRPSFTKLQGVWGALAMGGGICTMHYVGMQAMVMTVPIAWDMGIVAISVLIAVLASATALMLFRVLFKLEGKRLWVFQSLAALVMGAAICGMHYTGMSAANFAEGAVCLSANDLAGPELTAIILITTGLLLMATMFTMMVDAQLQSTTSRLNHSLQESNAQLQSANLELRKRAFADPLTDLPNRLLFEDRLRHALVRLERANHYRIEERLCIMFVDLDGFKPINDSFGHAVGDEILQHVGQRLSTLARSSDTVARVGGDEFLLLMEGVQNIADGIQLVQCVLSEVAHPYLVAGKSLQITASVGLVLFPDHGSPEHLVAHADAAMYVAKRNGGNGYAVFQPHMGSDAADQLALQNDLRHAMVRKEIALHYQPKVDGRTGEIIGAEALLRWQHPTRGMVSPVIFIPLAERFGIIHQLGGWVIEEACRQLAVWRDAGIHMRLAINLSVHQLRASGLAVNIAQALQQHGVEAEQLLCEITESVAMEDTAATQRTFEELGAIGVYLSIDDFGTGYSSLSYLRQLPAQQLKIDRSFIRDLETDEASRAVVQAVVHLAHALDLRVVAEGVETPGQRDILLAMHCDELQGFFFAYPMPAEQLTAWAAGEKPVGGADFAQSLRMPLVAV